MPGALVWGRSSGEAEAGGRGLNKAAMGSTHWDFTRMNQRVYVYIDTVYIYIYTLYILYIYKWDDPLSTIPLKRSVSDDKWLTRTAPLKRFSDIDGFDTE